MHQIIQLKGQAGRLDKVLTNIIGESRTLIQAHIQRQQVLVNGAVQKSNYKLIGNEEIEILSPLTDPKPLEITPQKVAFDILYEDEDILIVNKPSDLVVHPSKGHPDHTLVNGLVYYLNDQLSNEGEHFRPGIVHRIDKDTSGVLMVAKTNQAHRILAKNIENKTIKRTYLALVHGQVGPNKGTIDAPIKRHETHRTRFEVNIEGKTAITTFKVVKRYETATLLEVSLITGRTHQIRVHMEYIHHPIINDPVYCLNAPQLVQCIDPSFGQLLHAYQLTFDHPITQQPMVFQAPLPAEFQSYLDQLTY